jgi:hypothetical protein
LFPGWFVCIGSLINLLAVKLAGGLNNCLDSWLLVGWLVHWLYYLFACWLMDWVVGWLIFNCLAVQLVGGLAAVPVDCLVLCWWIGMY